jgi:glycosyltransferase involved in cell wall biosynthesis
MRVALIAPPWVPVPPPAYGGTETMLDLLARGLIAAGHDVVLFTTGDSTCEVPRSWVHPHAETLRMGMALPEIEHVIHSYRHADADVIHDHTVIGPLYAERFPALPVVTTNHGPFNDELNDVYRAISHRVPVIAISHHQASTAPADVWLAGVIHHGIDADRVRRSGRATAATACSSGGWRREGRAQGCEIARAAGRDLLIAAKMREPLEIAYFEDQVRPLLGPTASSTSARWTVDEKLTLLAGAEALVNPIRWPEPFGLVMIEALACGTPVLAFKEGAAPEIVEHGVTGFLCVDEGDTADHLDRLDELDRLTCRAAVEATSPSSGWLPRTCGSTSGSLSGELRGSRGRR